MWRVLVFLMISSCLWADESHPVLALGSTAPNFELPGVAMWECRADGIQLLPALQLQTEPELSAVPARGWGR